MAPMTATIILVLLPRGHAELGAVKSRPHECQAGIWGPYQ
jgi:hypothetical protein